MALLEEEGLTDRIDCDSAGTIGFHAGSPPDRRMQDVLRKHGVAVRGRSRQVDREDLDTFDVILAMDHDNLEGLKSLDPHGKRADKIVLFGEYCETYYRQEVPDPYYGGDGGFEKVYRMLDEGCRNLLKQLSTKR